MKALIFGAGGQVGRAIGRAVPPVAEVISLGRADCDVTDRHAIIAAIGTARPDVVFNAAAYTAVDKAEEEPDRAARLNADAPGWMAQAARGVGARMLHISTDFVFDGAQGAPYLPHDPTNPLSMYGRTKRDGELAVLAADADALVVRTAWVFGDAHANFVPAMLRMMAGRDRIGIVADQVSTPTAAASLAAALWRLATAESSGIHHFTDAGIASRYDQAVAIYEDARAVGLLRKECEIAPIRTEDYPLPARRPFYSVLDKTATWAVTGTPPHWRVNLRTCLKEIAANA